MKKFMKSHHRTMNELNITPLLDLVIVLLMIFIIAAPQLVNELELSLPSNEKPPESDPNQPPPELNFIDVDAAGNLKLNQRSYELATLRPVLAKLSKDNPEVSVVVRGSEETEYDKVVSVLDALERANITRIGLATATGAPVSTGR